MNKVLNHKTQTRMQDEKNKRFVYAKTLTNLDLFHFHRFFNNVIYIILYSIHVYIHLEVVAAALPHPVAVDDVVRRLALVDKHT